MEQTPVAIDTELAGLWRKLGSLDSQVAFFKKETAKGSTYYQAALDKALAAQAAVVAAIQPLAAEYSSRRWSRFFLVTNGNGHVHSSRNCQTCFPTTQYAWLPELSGATEQAAVAEYGESMCTVCFPSAPAMVKAQGPSRTAQAKAAAQAERAAKRAALAAKLVAKTLATPFRNHYGDRVETVAAAWKAVVDAAEVTVCGLYGDRINPAALAGYQADFQVAAEALAAKLGSTVADIQAQAVAKAKRRK